MGSVQSSNEGGGGTETTPSTKRDKAMPSNNEKLKTDQSAKPQKEKLWKPYQITRYQPAFLPKRSGVAEGSTGNVSIRGDTQAVP